MIQCPQCYQPIGEKILKKHLTKCNNNKKVVEISNEDIETPRKWHQKADKVSDIPQEFIDLLKQKIQNVYEVVSPQIVKREIIPNELDSLFSKEEIEGKNGKNILQEASLIGNMIKENILSPNGLFIELGCGAGEFSKTIQLFCNNSSNHLLVDRMKYTARHRYDHLIQAKIGNNFFDRLIIDIKYLDLNNYDKFNTIIGCSKHLCGSACDLSLDIFSNKLKQETANVSLAIATCCHYLLNAKTFINTQFFYEKGFTEEEFNSLTRLTSWSTLKDKSANYHFGKQIKELIDYARLEYLKQKGYKGIIVEYTTQTKENHLLLAYRNNNTINNNK